jgi:cytoplasmic tRNA 2-thiolation protein 2
MPGIAHLLVGETSTREAQRVISGTASGRGWSLPLELARARTLPSASGSDAEGVPLPAGVVRIKAIKELSLKEAALWCHARGLETANERRWDSTVGGARRDARGKGTIASIEALTERA